MVSTNMKKDKILRAKEPKPKPLTKRERKKGRKERKLRRLRK